MEMALTTPRASKVEKEARTIRGHNSLGALGWGSHEEPTSRTRRMLENLATLTANAQPESSQLHTDRSQMTRRHRNSLGVHPYA